MKVLLINGSPHQKGCTYTALCELGEALKKEGVDFEIYNVGIESISPCRACRACEKLGKCIIEDNVNEFLDYAKDFDGFVIGAPVHYASACGAISIFLDRAFYVDARAKRNIFKHKPGVAIVSARRAGTTATLDQLNKYFTVSQMPIISGKYWNMVHGNTPDDVRQDLEGLQNLRVIAKNMAYFLKCKDAGLKLGIMPPVFDEEIVRTNFIR